MANKVGDSGAASVPTARLSVFAAGMPASSATTDYATKTSTSARPDVCNPPASLFTNPPSAASDPGSA